MPAPCTIVFYIGEIARLIRAAKKWVTAGMGTGASLVVNRRGANRERRGSSVAVITITRTYPTRGRYVNYREDSARPRLTSRAPRRAAPRGTASGDDARSSLCRRPSVIRTRTRHSFYTPRVHQCPGASDKIKRQLIEIIVMRFK
jgi:hypothetical protein